MASALRFAARKICGRAFQRQAQPYFTAAAGAAVKEEQRRLFPSMSHGGSSVRRFCSSKSPNLVNNNKQATTSAAGSAKKEHTSPPPPWSPSSKMFLPFVGGVCAAGFAVIYVQDRLMGPFGSKEKSANSGMEPSASKKAE